MRIARGPLPCCLLFLLAACAEIPSTPQPEAAKPSPADTAIASAIAAHRQQAEHDASVGDLAGVEREWHILTLLAPGNAQFAARREATRTAIAQGAREHLQSAKPNKEGSRCVLDPQTGERKFLS